MTAIAIDEKVPASASYWTQVAEQTFSRRAARLASLWIGVIAFCAVFAPLLANTWPVLVKMDGHWSSPLARHLTPSDVILLVLGFSVIIAMFFRRTSRLRRAMWLAGIVVIASIFAFTFVHPPLTDDYTQYRELDHEGKIEAKLMAPLPLSANDFQRDVPDAELQAPSWRIFQEPKRTAAIC